MLKGLLAAATVTPSTGINSPLVQTRVASPPGGGGFEREFYAPLATDFTFPRFKRFSFYDHHGSFRETWPEPSCSVADRPTDMEPSEGKYHFVMDVHEFLSIYPFDVPMHISSVTCTWVTWAQNAKWQQFILDGSMRRTAEEFLLMLYIGAQAAGETSPGALRHIVGRPSYTVSTFDHGNPADAEPVREKNFDIYVRGLSTVSPSHPVPEALRRPRASHPDPVMQMKMRSSFPLAFARAHVAVWSKDPAPASTPHPAHVVADGYITHREIMVCNYWAFASQFALVMSARVINDQTRACIIVAVPMGHNGDTVAALMPRDGGCFAVWRDEGVPLLQQVQAFSGFLPLEVEPQQMSRTRDSRADIIFALPCSFRIRGAISTADEWRSVPPAHHATWCLTDALSDGQLILAALAFERARSFTHSVPWLHGAIGVYNAPRPVYANRAAEKFRSQHDSPDAEAEWSNFLGIEKDRRALFLRAFQDADGGTGILDPFLANILTAHDLADGLIPPPQGLPLVHADVVLLLPYPEPPAPLHTSYLARMPPQAAPDGFPESFAWEDVCRRWGRRCFAEALNATFDHDAECVTHGWSTKPRHPFICLGPSVFKFFHFQDGGKIRLNQFILVRGSDKRLRLFDFTSATGDHKKLEAVIGAMGFTTDKELLAFLIHGMRWKIEAPRHFRIGHNLFSLKSRAKGVGDATAKLIHAGLFDAFCVRDAGTPLSEDSPCPTWFTPQYSMGMGGADKNDKPDEKRPTGNVSEPHVFTRERNHPHGDPDGDPVVSFNDLTGIRNAGPDDHSSFPDREHKYRVREIYHANAYIRALAFINKTCPGLSRDDVRWMFFQIFTEPCEYWLQIQYLVIAYCESCQRFFVLCICTTPSGRVVVLKLWGIRPRVINMGSRPSSKVAVRFSKEVNVEWRARMADFVHSGWLDRQTPQLREVLALRERTLGYDMAHPFWCCEWTDDFWDLAVDPELCAHGALTRRTLAKQINLWLSAKASCGTVGDYIGARMCLTGGFGTATVVKRTRCVRDSLAALSDMLSKDELHAHNSFIVHMADILDLEPSVYQGLWATDKLPVPGFAIVAISEEHCAKHMRKPFAVVRAKYTDIVLLVSTKPAATFLSGVRDVPEAIATAPTKNPPLTVRMGSDCMATPTQMRIFGHALEYEWFLALDELDQEWANRHVDVGESTGCAVNVATFGLMFATFQLVQEGDNTTEGAMLLGTSKAADQQSIRSSIEKTAGFQACKQSLWFEHSYGSGLGFDDAGSRGKDGVLSTLAAAFGRRRVPIDVLQVIPGVKQLLSDILRLTTPYAKRPRRSAPRVRFAPNSADLRAALPEERGDGICSSAFCNSASQGLSPTPPRARHTSPPPPPERLRQLSPTPPRPAGPEHQPPTADESRRVSPTPPRPHTHRATSPVFSVMLTHQLASDDHASRLSPTPPRPGTTDVHRHAPRSPQPANAKTARAIAAFQAPDTLLGTSNPYLPGSKAPASTRALIVASKTCAHEGIPINTGYHDSWGFKWASSFCTEHDMPVMRPRLNSPHVDPDAEAEAMALMLFWIAPRMKPSPRKAAKGILNAQPPSALQAIYAYRRVQRDCGRYLADMGKAAALLKGMNVAFLKAWGQEALATDHHIPFALDVIRRAHDALATLAIATFSVCMHHAIDTVILFSLVRGPRLDEWCRMHTDDTFYRRANFVWVSGRTLIGSTDMAWAQSGPQDGWLLRVQNVPSKTDRNGRRWLGRYMWYVLNSASSLNFPARWLRWETSFPCPEHLRRVWPAFSPTGDHEAFSPACARQALQDILLQLEGRDLADMHTWHDFRATIASALKGANRSDATVQALVCWASAASVQIYGQLTPELMAAEAEIATFVDASRHAHLPTPHIGPESVAAELAACVDAIEAAQPKRAAPAKTAQPKKSVTKQNPPKPTTNASAAPPAPRAKTKRHRPESPVTAVPPRRAPVAELDVGAPHGLVRIDTTVPLADTHAMISNTAWCAGPGSTSCCIIGDVGDPSNGGFHVVVSSDDGHAYPFTSTALRRWAALSQGQLALLPAQERSPEVTLLNITSPATETLEPSRVRAAPRTPTRRTPVSAVVRRSPRLVELETERST